MNRICESMTQVHIGVFRVRVWRNELSIEQASLHQPNNDIRHWARNLDFKSSSISPDRIFASFEKTFNNFVAMEVVDARGNGAILYPDWS